MKGSGSVLVEEGADLVRRDIDAWCHNQGRSLLRSLLFQARRQIEELAHMSKGCSECMNGVGIVDC